MVLSEEIGGDQKWSEISSTEKTLSMMMVCLVCLCLGIWILCVSLVCWLVFMGRDRRSQLQEDEGGPRGRIGQNTRNSWDIEFEYYMDCCIYVKNISKNDKRKGLILVV